MFGPFDESPARWKSQLPLHFFPHLNLQVWTAGVSTCTNRYTELKNLPVIHWNGTLLRGRPCASQVSQSCACHNVTCGQFSTFIVVFYNAVKALPFLLLVFSKDPMTWTQNTTKHNLVGLQFVEKQPNGLIETCDFMSSMVWVKAAMKVNDTF